MLKVIESGNIMCLMKKAFHQLKLVSIGTNFPSISSARLYLLLNNLFFLIYVLIRQHPNFNSYTLINTNIY